MISDYGNSNKLEQLFRLSLIYTVIIFVMVVQFGGQGKILSVSFFGYLLAWIFFGIRAVNVNEAIFVLILMLPSLIFVINTDYFIDAVARIVREYSVLLFFITARYSRFVLMRGDDIRRVAFSIQLLCLFYSLFQFYFIAIDSPSYFIPYDYYGNISGSDYDTGSDSRSTTVPSYWIEFGSYNSLTLGEEYKVRPTASFTEPSYLAFIMLLTAFFVDNEKDSLNGHVFLAYLGALTTSLIAQSGSGILFVVALGFYSLVRRSPQRVRSTLLLSLIPIVFLFMAFTAGQRVLQISDVHEELSGFIRVVMPLIHIYDIFADGNIFGITPSGYYKFLSPYYMGMYIGLGVDNSVFNILMSYGLFGLLILIYVYKSFDAVCLCFIFACAQFNGALFGYDKGFLVGAALFQYYGSRNSLAVKRFTP